MGVAPSKTLTNHLLSAISNTQGDTFAQTTLRDPAFLAAVKDCLLDLKEHWHSLPPDLQSAIADFGSLKPRLIVGNGVTPAQVEAWIKTPETFFDLSADVPPRQLFTRLQELSSLDEDDGLAAIRRRIYLILFHDLRSAFNLLNTKLSFVAYLSSGGQYYDNTEKEYGMGQDWREI